MEQQFLQQTTSNQKQMDRQVKRYSIHLEDFAVSPKGIHASGSHFFKNVPRLPKRKDLAPFGISLTRYLAIEEAYFFMQKRSSVKW